MKLDLYFWNTQFTYHKMHFHGTFDLKKVGLETCFLLQEPQETENVECKVMYLFTVHSSWCSTYTHQVRAILSDISIFDVI